MFAPREHRARYNASSQICKLGERFGRDFGERLDFVVNFRFVHDSPDCQALTICVIFPRPLISWESRSAGLQP